MMKVPDEVTWKMDLTHICLQVLIGISTRNKKHAHLNTLYFKKMEQRFAQRRINNLFKDHFGILLNILSLNKKNTISR